MIHSILEQNIVFKEIFFYDTHDDEKHLFSERLTLAISTGLETSE